MSEKYSFRPFSMRGRKFEFECPLEPPFDYVKVTDEETRACIRFNENGGVLTSHQAQTFDVDEIGKMVKLELGVTLAEFVGVMCMHIRRWQDEEAAFKREVYEAQRATNTGKRTAKEAHKAQNENVVIQNSLPLTEPVPILAHMEPGLPRKLSGFAAGTRVAVYHHGDRYVGEGWVKGIIQSDFVHEKGYIPVLHDPDPVIEVNPSWQAEFWAGRVVWHDPKDIHILDVQHTQLILSPDEGNA